MTDRILFPTEAQPGETVRAILRHLCLGSCKTYGSVLEWCESRGDCAQAVICRACGARFLVERDDLDELTRWTDESGALLACGVRWE